MSTNVKDMSREEKIKSLKRDDKGRFIKGERGFQFHESEYKEEYCQQLKDFFDREPYKVVTDFKGRETIIPNDLPTICGFCNVINITEATYFSWINKYPSFKVAHAYALKKQKEMLFINGMNKSYSENLVKFLLVNNHGMSDKTQQDTELTIKVESDGDVSEEAN